jgi:hypothetical protein
MVDCFFRDSDGVAFHLFEQTAFVGETNASFSLDDILAQMKGDRL